MADIGKPPPLNLQLKPEWKISIAVARFNSDITGTLLQGAVEAYAALGGAGEPHVMWVPGAFELPLAAQWLVEKIEPAAGAVICLGCVIRGDTDHYEYVCRGAAEGILQVSLKCNIPVIFGVLTVDTPAQAWERAGGALGNKGAEALHAAAEMLTLRENL